MLRVWLASILAVVALLAVRDARAASVAEARPRAAAHAAFVSGAAVAWTTTYADSASSDPTAPAQRIVLASPVRAAFDADRSPGVAAVVDAEGRITAFVVDATAFGWPRNVQVALREDLERSGEEIVLHPPLARAPVERVEVAGEGDVRFEPSPSAGLVHNVGSWSTQGLSERARHATDDALGGHDASLDEPPLYLAPTPELSHGLRGRTLTAAERARPGKLVAITVFFLLLIAFAAAYRWLSGRARVEVAEAALREEFERSAR